MSKSLHPKYTHVARYVTTPTGGTEGGKSAYYFSADTNEEAEKIGTSYFNSLKDPWDGLVEVGAIVEVSVNEIIDIAREQELDAEKN